MAKKLKINIKNTQIAEALKKTKAKLSATQIKTTKKKTSAKVSSVALEEELPAKRKARIIPAKLPEKEKLAVSEEKKSVKPKKAPIITEKEEALQEEQKAIQKEKAVSEEPVVKPGVIKEKQPPKEEEVSEDESKEKTLEEELAEKRKKEKEAKKPVKKVEPVRKFDSRDRMGLRSDEEEAWKRRRPFKRQKKKFVKEEDIVRPSHLSIKLPISIKALASAMKIKASELIAKLFLQGMTFTLNDELDDETTVQLLGQEFRCEITIDTAEEKLIRITDKSIQEEIQSSSADDLIKRPPIITFMGHVDHGKTSLIDAIRKSNITQGEAGAITQHIGAFTATTALGEITILDTPGHEAFSEIRSRGANVTDIVVLVIAGDEGVREQTIEALQQAKEAKVSIIIAINKADKAGYDPEKIYRQLADHDLLPEAWGGTVITVNTSATTKQGIDNLLEMLSLQSEMLELKANPQSRARGTVLETEMHKGFGATATVLVQNGTLHVGDAIVFSDQFGRIKTMHDHNFVQLQEAPPSMPVKITGLSGLADAGSEFIVVNNEKEARHIADERKKGNIKKRLQQSKKSLDHILAKENIQKILPIVIRTDVQGSLEALHNALLKIKSQKVRLDIVSEEVGEISESDIELASASSAIILGFHTRTESHAENLIKSLKVRVYLHDIIYHAIDEIKAIMKSLLDKTEEENNRGEAHVKAIFKSSHLGLIAGCQVDDGTINRNHLVRVLRKKEVIWKGKISSIKREKDDVKEVSKGQECGIVLEGFSDLQVGDIIQAYEISYLEQDL